MLKFHDYITFSFTNLLTSRSSNVKTIIIKTYYFEEFKIQNKYESKKTL